MTCLISPHYNYPHNRIKFYVHSYDPKHLTNNRLLGHFTLQKCGIFSNTLKGHAFSTRRFFFDDARVHSYHSTTDCYGLLPYKLSNRAGYFPSLRLMRCIIPLHNACVHSYNLYNLTTNRYDPSALQTQSP